MDSKYTITNFKDGESVSFIDQQNNSMVSDHSKTSFVVLARDVTEPLLNLTPNKEAVSRCDLNEPQTVPINASHINRMERRLHQVEEKIVKLKKMLQENNAAMKKQFEKIGVWQKEVMSEESDAALKQRFEKIETWQKIVMSVCQVHNKKYTEMKNVVNRIETKNDSSCSPTTSTASSLSTYKKQSFAQNDSSANDIILPFQIRDSSLDNDTTVISLQKSINTTQTPTMELQGINTETSTKPESVTNACVDTQGSVRETQGITIQTDMQSNVSQSQTSATDINKKLYELEDNRRLKKLSEKLTTYRRDVTSACQNLVNRIAFDSNNLHKKKRNLTQERESLNELKKSLADEMKSNPEQQQELIRENAILTNRCDVLETDLENLNTKLRDSHRTIAELRNQITELQNATLFIRQNQLNGALLEQAKNEALHEKIHSFLNKPIPGEIDTFVNQVRELKIYINIWKTFQGVVDLVFEKAVDNRNYAVACALMSKELSNLEIVGDADDSSSANFRKLFVTRCQTELERNCAVNEDVSNEKLSKIAKCTDLEKKKEPQLNLEQEERKRCPRFVGNILLIGELFKQNLLTCKIMEECIRDLLNQVDDMNLECLCILLTTTGKVLEAKKIYLLSYFVGMRLIANYKDKIRLKTQLMVENVIALRTNKWIGYELYLKLWLKFNVAE